MCKGSGQVVVVTGGNGGIGRALIESLADSGYTLAVCSSSHDFGNIGKLHESKKNHSLHHLDFTDEPSILKAAKEIKRHHRVVYGLVNCAAIAHGSLFSMTKISDLRRVFEVNYFGTVIFSQYIAKQMIKSKMGSIVNVASTAGLLSDPGTLAYGGSKAALVHSTKVMAKELGNFNIRVNAIAPSVVDVGMSSEMDENSIRALDERSAISGIVSSADVVHLIQFLLSLSSAKITGQVLRLDRGLT